MRLRIRMRLYLKGGSGVVRLISILILIGLTLSSSLAFAESPTVVVSISPLYMILKDIAGERLNLRLLVSPGESPHTYSPKPSDLAFLSKAQAFLVIGFGLEGFLDSLKKVKGPKLVEVGELMVKMGLLKPIRAKGSHHHHHEHDVNPHIWLSPKVGIKLVEFLTQWVSGLDPSGKETYLKRSSAIVEELKTLDKEMKEFFSRVRVSMIDFHGAFEYMAKDYGFEIVGVVQETPGEEPSGKFLAELIKKAKAHSVKLVVIEPQMSQKMARMLANEIGAKLVVLDPLGDPERDSYPLLLRRSFEAIKEALR